MADTASAALTMTSPSPFIHRITNLLLPQQSRPPGSHSPLQLSTPRCHRLYYAKASSKYFYHCVTHVVFKPLIKSALSGVVSFMIKHNLRLFLQKMHCSISLFLPRPAFLTGLRIIRTCPLFGYHHDSPTINERLNACLQMNVVVILLPL
ncbi:hypothetical protein BDR04DRAFT_769215 [Suillus decipiens]|nr:hypothetical protein BDR04DRAFT_769215 [Suillus decipiens]